MADPLTDARYVRDVLLVCDAMHGTDLPLLARQFRVAGECMARASRPGHHAGPPQGWAANTSGFGVSQPLPVGQAASDSLKPWFSPSRWFA